MFWLGREDSNLRMAESKSLPNLGFPPLSGPRAAFVLHLGANKSDPWTLRWQGKGAGATRTLSTITLAACDLLMLRSSVMASTDDRTAGYRAEAARSAPQR